MQQGDTFLMGNPGGRTKHLWMILSDPLKHGGAFVIVNLTSPDVAHSTCVLKFGEHPWLKYDSDVNFGDSLEITAKAANNITVGINSNTIIPQVPLSISVVQRIVAAAQLSPAFSRRLKIYL